MAPQRSPITIRLACAQALHTEALTISCLTWTNRQSMPIKQSVGSPNRRCLCNILSLSNIQNLCTHTHLLLDQLLGVLISLLKAPNAGAVTCTACSRTAVQTWTSRPPGHWSHMTMLAAQALVLHQETASCARLRLQPFQWHQHLGFNTLVRNGMSQRPVQGSKTLLLI
jgi:hypothetical protein